MKIQRKGIRGRVTALTVVAFSVAGLAMTPLGSAFAAEEGVKAEQPVAEDPFDSDGEGPDLGGPVVYLSRHGIPANCSFSVQTWDMNGKELESTSLFRTSCDGTLWLKPGARKIHIYNGNSIADIGGIGSQPLDETIDPASNARAYCVLAKAEGVLHYTNESEKGGACNGD